MKRVFKKTKDHLRNAKGIYLDVITPLLGLVFGVLCIISPSLTSDQVLLLGVFFSVDAILDFTSRFSKISSTGGSITVTEEVMLDDLTQSLGNNIKSISYDTSTHLWTVSYLNDLESNCYETEMLVDFVRQE